MFASDLSEDAVHFLKINAKKKRTAKILKWLKQSIEDQYLEKEALPVADTDNLDHYLREPSEFYVRLAGAWFMEARFDLELRRHRSLYVRPRMIPVHDEIKLVGDTGLLSMAYSAYSSLVSGSKSPAEWREALAKMRDQAMQQMTYWSAGARPMVLMPFYDGV